MSRKRRKSAASTPAAAQSRPVPPRQAAIAAMVAAESRDTAIDQTISPTTTTSSPSTTDPSMKGPAMNNTNNNFEAFSASARENVEKASQTAFRTYEELSKFQKDNWEAFVAASQIWVKGAETMGRAWMNFTQESVETAASAAKALVGAKTVREAMDMQSEWAKGNLDKFMAETTKLSETAIKVANEAVEPLTARINVAVEKMTKPMAA
jgi:phasin family protein